MASFGAVSLPVNLENKILILRTWSTLAAQAGVNTSHWEVTAVVGGGLTLGQVVQQFDLGVVGFVKPLLGSDATYVGTEGRVILPGPPEILSAAAFNKDSMAVGTGGTPPLPSQVAGLLKLVTNRPGRQGRGRWYLPFPDASRLTAVTGEPTGAYVTLLASLGTFLSSVQTLVSGGNSITLQPILLAEKDWTVTDVVGAAARGHWATQRRRGDYGRPNTTPF